jgi:hypothetical protein
MTRRKRILFSLTAIALALAVPLAAALAGDVYLHHRVERRAGVNVWGYRGPRVPAKKPGEHRLAMLGGSTVFGYGVEWNETIPVFLERQLARVARAGSPVTVVNLGIVGHGAYSLRWTLEDYRSLDIDTVVLYEGYNDLSEVINLEASHRDSPLFRLTGYYPIFPVALREKAMALRAGDVETFYRDEQKTVFRPTLAKRTTAGALEAVARVGRTLDQQLGRLAASPVVQADGGLRVSDTDCPAAFKHYCGAMYDAITYALAAGRKVLVVTQPYVHEYHRAQQEALRQMLMKRLLDDPRVGYTTVGELIDMTDERLCFDRMHLTAIGNELVAAHLVMPLVTLMPDAFDPPEATAR